MQHHLLYTIAGHIGDGNFHIIPLMNLAKRKRSERNSRAAAQGVRACEKFSGSMTGEHNDGIIRTPYSR